MIWNSITTSVSLQHLENDSQTLSIIPWLLPSWILVLSFSLTSLIKLLWTSALSNSGAPRADSSPVCCFNELRKNNRARKLYMFNSLTSSFVLPLSFLSSIPDMSRNFFMMPMFLSDDSWTETPELRILVILWWVKTNTAAVRISLSWVKYGWLV